MTARPVKALVPGRGPGRNIGGGVVLGRLRGRGPVQALSVQALAQLGISSASVVQSFVAQQILLNNTPTTTVVASLPAASPIPAGKFFVTDSTQTLAAGIGTTVVGGGANTVPVHSNGTNWIIG